MGMGIAMMMLKKSLQKGKLADYTQFDTCRNLRSAASNLYMATADANENRATLKAKGGNVLHLQDDAMQSLFMERFAKGMKIRMPVESNRNLPLMGPVVRRILDGIELELVSRETTPKRKRLLTMVGGYISTTYTYALRGNEGFWVDGDALVEKIHIGKYDTVTPHIVIALIGFFKAEGGERMHVLSLANDNTSGTRVRSWLERVAGILREEGKIGCPAFCDEEGFILQSDEVERIMHPIISALQGTPGLEQFLPFGIDVETYYRCERSFRRGSENTALVQKVCKRTIEFVHRWRSFETNRGKLPGFDMLRHYADGESTRPLQLDFTAAV